MLGFGAQRRPSFTLTLHLARQQLERPRGQPGGLWHRSQISPGLLESSEEGSWFEVGIV